VQRPHGRIRILRERDNDSGDQHTPGSNRQERNLPGTNPNLASEHHCPHAAGAGCQKSSGSQQQQRQSNGQLLNGEGGNEQSSPSARMLSQPPRRALRESVGATQAAPPPTEEEEDQADQAESHNIRVASAHPHGPTSHPPPDRRGSPPPQGRGRNLSRMSPTWQSMLTGHTEFSKSATKEPTQLPDPTVRT
jgi:hypothetical protein